MRHYPQNLVSIALTLTSLLCASQIGGAQPSSPLAPSGPWTPVSDPVLKQLTDAGKKIGYPGGTAGVCVDRTNGDLYMVVPDQGMWKSTDRGTTFTRTDGGAAGGRCETGFALNPDPAGKRMACFMLDGPANLVSGSGKNWHLLQQHGRGWDYGTVDWSSKDPQVILAIHHESGCELHLSTDAGASWKLLGKDFTSVGIFDAHTFVASKGSGILRSIDAGATWTPVSEMTPSGRTLCVLNARGYWVCRQGLLVSDDKGATWHTQGSAIEATWGPFFGKTAKDIVVVGRVDKEAGFFRSDDAGSTWRLAAPFPTFEKENIPDWTPAKQWAAGWFCCFGWDPSGNIFYASRMGHPALKYQTK